MALIEWSEEYSIHVEELDNQHRGLFDVINALDDAMQRGEGREALAPVLQGLLTYAVEHFSTEEALMVDWEYPGYEEQHLEHDGYIRRIGDFSEDLNEGRSGLTDEVMFFLRNWLSAHILKLDMRLGTFVNEKGLV